MSRTDLERATLPTNAADIDASASDVTLSNAGVIIYVGTGGDVEVVAKDSATSVVFHNVADATFLPLLVKEVKTAGTTASDLIALA